MRLAPARPALVRALATATLVCAISSAAAQCVLDIPNQVQLGSYDPGALLQNPIGWRFRVSTQTGCAGRIQLDALDATGRLLLQGPDTAGFTVLMAQDASGSTPVNAAPLDAAAVQIAAGQQVTVSMWAVRPAGQWRVPGPYRGAVRVSLLDKAGLVLTRRDLAFLTAVSPTVQLHWEGVASGSGSPTARLDFGELVQGATRSASLVVQANSSHTIALESTQRGQLVNAKFPLAGLSYSLRLNGRALALGPNASDVRMATPGKVRHEIEVRIGPIERVLAGEYLDSLLVTVAAQ